jgi:hypothetical protein
VYEGLQFIVLGRRKVPALDGSTMVRHDNCLVTRYGILMKDQLNIVLESKSEMYTRTSYVDDHFCSTNEIHTQIRWFLEVLTD